MREGKKPSPESTTDLGLLAEQLQGQEMSLAELETILNENLGSQIKVEDLVRDALGEESLKKYQKNIDELIEPDDMADIVQLLKAKALDKAA